MRMVITENQITISNNQKFQQETPAKTPGHKKISQVRGGSKKIKIPK